MTHHLRLTLQILLSAALLLPATALAQIEPNGRPLHPPKPILSEPAKIHAYAGVDFVTMYISRGQVYSSKASMQPWAAVYLPLTVHHLGPRFNELGVILGTWNSIQPGAPGLDQPRSVGNFFQNWYESDYHLGLQAQFLSHYQTSLRFNYYTSPSDSFADIQEIDWRLRYHNPELWKSLLGSQTTFTLNPRLRVTKETRDHGGPNKAYIEPSVTPTITLKNLPAPVSVSMPLTLGFGADGQYHNADGRSIPFGYFGVGLGVSVPLRVLPKNAGSIDLNVGVNVIIASEKSITYWNQRILPVGHIGLSYSF